MHPLKMYFLLSLILGIFAWLPEMNATNVLNIGHYQITPNTEFSIELMAENDSSFVAFQVDIPLPNGFRYVEGSAVLNATRITGHSLNSSLISGNILRLIGYSVGNTAFLGNAGTLASFKLKSCAAPATYGLNLIQPVMSNDRSVNVLSSFTNGSATVLAPDIRISTNSIDFGRVPLLTSPVQYLQISNVGNTNLTIGSLSFSDPQFSTTETPVFVISPNGSRSIPIQFAPTVKGTLSKQLVIESNDSDQPSVTVNLNAVAFAVNEVHTGAVTGSSSSTGTLEFALNNMEPFTGFQFDLVLPAPLTYKAGSGQLFRAQDQTLSVSQLNAQTLRILVFSAENKPFTGKDGKILSLDFLLKGTAGYYPIGINNVVLANSVTENILSASYDGYLVITSPDIDANNEVAFGEVSVSAEGHQMLRVNNYGQEPLTITQLLFSNTCFTSSQTLPVTIPSNGAFDLPVAFAKLTEGAASGTLKIISDDPDENPFSVQLTANAFIPNYLRIQPTSCKQREQKLISVEVDNLETFVAFQFDLSHPVGLTPNLSDIVLSNRKQDHVALGVNISPTTLRILVYSPGQKTFTNHEGTVLQIPFQVSSDLTPNTYPLTFSNALLSDINSQNILYSSTNGSLDVQQYYDTVTWDGSQWSAIPSSLIDVVLTGNYSGAGFSCHHLSIEAGKHVSIQSGNLTVGGDLVLRADATGTATLLEEGGTLSLTGSATVEQEVTGAGGTVPSGRFWYLTSPVVGARSSVFSASGPNKLWSYKEDGGNSEAQVYTEITNDITSLIPGCGYVARLTGNETVKFMGGSLVNGNQTLPLSYTATSPKPGFNLIGNPYPSYLNIRSALNATTNLESTIWCRSYNPVSKNMVFDTYNAFTGVEISTPSGNSPLTENIPPMQAFWVKAKQVGELTLTNAMRSHQSAGIKLRNALSDVFSVRLQVSNGPNMDQTVIAYFPEATNTFDKCDSRKMFNYVDAIPEIYTLIGSDPVAINGLSALQDVQELKLGFKTAVEGSFTLKATEIQNLPPDVKVILKDRLLNVEQYISQNPTYVFNSGIVSSVDRFVLEFRKMTDELENKKILPVEIKATANRIEIFFPDKINSLAEISLYDALGQQLITRRTNDSFVQLKSPFVPGVYFIKIDLNKIHITRKVLIN